jgi:hypothetical protein
MRRAAGVAGSQSMRTTVQITWHGAQTNFGDLTPYLTYDLYVPFIQYCMSFCHLSASVSVRSPLADYPLFMSISFSMGAFWSCISILTISPYPFSVFVSSPLYLFSVPLSLSSFHTLYTLPLLILGTFCPALIKKKKIFLICREIQKGAAAKSYMNNDLLNPHIWLNICTFPHILGSPSS